MLWPQIYGMKMSEFYFLLLITKRPTKQQFFCVLYSIEFFFSVIILCVCVVSSFASLFSTAFYFGSILRFLWSSPLVNSSHVYLIVSIESFSPLNFSSNFFLLFSLVFSLLYYETLVLWMLWLAYRWASCCWSLLLWLLRWKKKIESNESQRELKNDNGIKS